MKTDNKNVTKWWQIFHTEWPDTENREKGQTEQKVILWHSHLFYSNPFKFCSNVNVKLYYDLSTNAHEASFIENVQFIE